MKGEPFFVPIGLWRAKGGENMDKEIAKYIHRHTRLVTAVIVTTLLLLGVGEYYLYRKVMYISQIVSEGFMQIKELNKPKTQIMMKKGKMMLKREGELKLLDMNFMMSSGTKVMIDGQVIRPDGTKLRLQEEQIMDLE